MSRGGIGIAAVGFMLLFLPAALGRSAEAADALSAVGDERLVGKNRTGEDCRLRLMERRPAGTYERLALFCEGWSQPSGEIRRFRAQKDSPPDRLLTDSPWQQWFLEHLSDCGPVEPTTLTSNTAAALRVCKRADGGWPVLVLAAVVGTRSYELETFPTNLPLLELAVEALEGKRPLGETASTPVLSAAIRRAETMVGGTGRLIGIQDIGAHATLYRMGSLQLYAGQYAESEATFRRALEIEERAGGPDQPASGTTLAWIGLNVGDQGRFTEADQIFARAEPLVQRSPGERDKNRLWLYEAIVNWRRGRLDVAMRFAEDALKSREREAQVRRIKSSDDTVVANILTIMADIAVDLGRLDDADRAASRALQIVEQPGYDADFRAWWTAETRLAIGRVRVAQKRFADARREYQLAFERNRLLFGDSLRGATALAYVAEAARLDGDLPAAVTAYRETAQMRGRDASLRERTRADHLAAYFDVLIEAGQTVPADRDRLAAEAFVAAQIPRGNETARAIANMAARLDAADPAIRAAARAYQEARRRRDQARHGLALETLKPSDKRDPAREETLKQDLRTAEGQVASLESRLQAELPRYARLTAQAPVPVDELAPALRPGEAVLVLLPTRRATYVLLLRDGTASLHRAALPRADLERAVKQIRASLDVADGTVKPFDTAAAHQLYTQLIAPVADRLGGVTHLITVPAGPLLALPLGLLPTSISGPGAPGEPGSPADYRQVPWLARQFAISVLPATASLRELRQGAGRSAAPQSFIGFGDPAFAGAEGDTRSLVAMAGLCRQGEPMDPQLLRDLPRLPETARELQLIARALGAPADSVILGAQATESRVRGTDLSQFRVIAFATHGLLPGELRCKAEPALALTPPAASSSTEDGLLDASEVAQLRLDADWVVLSACNTAGPDGKLGGESLSGLARAFFYAGARAVLVSHWAVASRATVFLTTGMFDAYAKTPGLGRAEVLRRAQLALLARAETSHPFFWAAFTLVGDGGGGGPAS